jgi:competence protein ComEA
MAERNDRQQESRGENRGGKIDLNRASKEELMRLDGIGDQTAERILRHREENGPFRSLEDLDPIPGFNRERIENFQDRFSV